MLNLLLDTHAFLWVRHAPERRHPRALQSFDDPDSRVFVSIVSLWEAAIKARLGELNAPMDELMAGLFPASKVQLLHLLPEHLRALQALPFHKQHRDPFDHLIITQALAEDMTRVSSDRRTGLCSVKVIEAQA